MLQRATSRVETNRQLYARQGLCAITGGTAEKWLEEARCRQGIEPLRLSSSLVSLDNIASSLNLKQFMAETTGCTESPLSAQYLNAVQSTRRRSNEYSGAHGG